MMYPHDTPAGYDETAEPAQEMGTFLVIAAVIIVIVLTLTFRAYAKGIFYFTGHPSGIPDRFRREPKTE